MLTNVNFCVILLVLLVPQGVSFAMVIWIKSLAFNLIYKLEQEEKVKIAVKLFNKIN